LGFPPWFGRNYAAFDDFMRDLDNLSNKALEKPFARAYLTEVTRSHFLLVEEPNVFSWFANKIAFYRDYYRDELSPPAVFVLLLSAPDRQAPPSSRTLAIRRRPSRRSGRLDTSGRGWNESRSAGLCCPHIVGFLPADLG
jgi:hypothetical protein